VGDTGAFSAVLTAEKEMIQEAWLAWTARDARRIWEWAGQFVKLFAPLTKTGDFSVDETRHFIGPFDALQDDEVREVNILAPVRDGKTLIVDAWLPWIIENDPGPFVWIFQKDDIAKEHAETRTQKMLKAVPSIAAKWPLGHQGRTQEIEFAHMPVYIWGPAINNLQSKGFRYIVLDELWLYPNGRIDEAKGRRGDFEKLGLDKLLCISQGGYAESVSEDHNRGWFDQYSSGELNEWHVPCLGCGEFMMPVWSRPLEKPSQGANKRKRWGIVWDEIRDSRGMWDVERCVETVRFECFRCAHKHFDGPKIKGPWNTKGRYQIIGEQKRRKKSFHWTGVITYPWTTLLEEFLNARNVAAQGDRSKTVIFFQKKMADFHDPRKGDDEFERLPEVEVLTPMDGAQIEMLDPGTGRRILFTRRLASIDVQKNHLWLMIDAWNQHGDDVTLWFEKLLNWEEAAERITKWKVAPEDVCVDVNYHDRAQEVIRECARHGYEQDDGSGNVKWISWKAFRGSPRAEFKYTHAKGPQKGQTVVLPYDPVFERGDPCAGLPSNDSRRGEFQGKLCQIYLWSNPWIKDVVVARRDGLAKACRSLVAPGDWVTEFSKQMHGERKLPRQDRFNNTILEWHKTNDNHGLDCKCMTTVRAWQRGYVAAMPAKGEKAKG
jgi:hypothetical protein